MPGVLFAATRGGAVACAIAAVATALSAGAAQAQVSPALPQGSPIPRIAPATGPSVAAPPITAPAPEISRGNPEDVFQLSGATVEGSTVYADASWTTMIAGMRGRVTRAQVEAVRREILSRYRADGYLLTGVTLADGGGGRVRFVVTEGHIAEVKLDGDIGPAGTQVLRFLNRLTETNPIDSATLERALLLAQDVPGVAVRAVLRPSAEAPGALTLVAQVQRAAWSGIAVADNRGTPFTGPEGALLAIDANSFTEYGERTTASLFRSFNNTQIYGQLASEAFIGSSGLKIRLFGGSGTADPSGGLRASRYHGVTTNVGLTASYPVIRTRQQTLGVFGTFELLDSEIFTGQPSRQASRDNLRILRGGTEYARQDSWLGAQRSAINQASLKVSRGLAAFGASTTNPLNVGRQNQVVEFTKVNIYLSRNQTLFQPWDGATVALQATLAAQYTPDILPSAEKFYLGGARLNRGYYAGEVTGDKAWATAIELQLNTSFAFDLVGYPMEVASTFYGFYDWGETVENQKSDPNRRLHSFGAGTRLRLTTSLSVDLEWAHRVVRRPLGVQSGTPALRGDAFYWRLVSRF
ncbi:MAG: ShlB/FhaC/HecB family hemolysin secretion/activation protein [Acetobacteraceae bacterium]|nr:ShlB/FhaC/HecB family hemolysin secretion/activation protein [Acetobacteraceae bacterium]